MTSALLEIVRTGQTSHPLLIRIFQAQKINRVLGGGAVMPWQIDDLPREWVQAMCALVDELPGLSKMETERRAYMDEWESKRRKKRK